MYSSSSKASRGNTWAAGRWGRGRQGTAGRGAGSSVQGSARDARIAALLQKLQQRLVALNSIQRKQRPAPPAHARRSRPTRCPPRQAGGAQRPAEQHSSAPAGHPPTLAVHVPLGAHHRQQRAGLRDGGGHPDGLVVQRLEGGGQACRGSAWVKQAEGGDAGARVGALDRECRGMGWGGMQACTRSLTRSAAATHAPPPSTRPAPWRLRCPGCRLPPAPPCHAPELRRAAPTYPGPWRFGRPGCR